MEYSISRNIKNQLDLRLEFSLGFEAAQSALWTMTPTGGWGTGIWGDLICSELDSESFSLFFLGLLSSLLYFGCTFLMIPFLSLVKCSILTSPYLSVTWTASWVVPSLSIHLWHWCVLPVLLSFQSSVSCERPSWSVHLWTWWTFPSLSELYSASWDSPVLLVQRRLKWLPLGLLPALLDSVWTCPDSDFTPPLFSLLWPLPRRESSDLS